MFWSLSFLIHDPRTPTSEWVALSTEPGSSPSQDQPKRGFQPHPLGPPPSPSFQLQGPFSQTLECSTSVYLPLLSLLPEMPSPPSLFMEQCLPNWYPSEKLPCSSPLSWNSWHPTRPQFLFSLGKKRTTQLERFSWPPPLP